MPRKNNVDKEYYDNFLYCRINSELKKKLNIKALKSGQKIYEYLNDLISRDVENE